MLLTKVITYPHLLLGKGKTGETNFVPSTGSHTSLYIIYSEVRSYSRNVSNLFLVFPYF